MDADDEAEVRRQFAQRLSSLLYKRGYKENRHGRNTRLAGELNIDPQAVYRLLNGQIPKPMLMKRLCRLLNTTSDFLYGLTDDYEPPIANTEPLIRWFWHPETEPFEPFEVPHSTQFDDSMRALAFYARAEEVNLELVVFDANDTTLRSRQNYLFLIEDHYQIRTVESMPNNMAKLWFEGKTLECDVHLDSMCLARNGSPFFVIGRIIGRTRIEALPRWPTPALQG